MRAAHLHSPNVVPNGVESLENQLKLSLRPVKPNQEFVDHLHDRLTTPVNMTIERRQHTAFSLLLIAFSLISGILVVSLMRHFRSASYA